MTAATFQIGKTYKTRSACDHECVFSFTVIKRTAKFVTLETHRGEMIRAGVNSFDGVERCYPLGRYSMAPQISAE